MAYGLNRFIASRRAIVLLLLLPAGLFSAVFAPFASHAKSAPVLDDDARAGRIEVVEDAPPNPSNPQAIQHNLDNVPEALQPLVMKGLVSAEDLHLNPPLTRGKMATIMANALDYQTDVVSEFPFYRDVPTDSPYYHAVEILREKGLFTPQDAGFYHPDKPITFRTLYAVFANKLTGKNLPIGEVAYLLRQLGLPAEDIARLRLEDAQAIAKWQRAGLLEGLVTPPVTMAQLRMSETVPLQDFANNLITLTKRYNRDFFEHSAVERVAWLPAGLELYSTPSGVLRQELLTAGSDVFFSLVTPVALPNGTQLPEDTKIHGTVQAIQAENNRYTLMFDDVITPQSVHYKLVGTLTVTVTASGEKQFLVPGQGFTIHTESAAERIEEAQNVLEASTSDLTSESTH